MRRVLDHKIPGRVKRKSLRTEELLSEELLLTALRSFEDKLPPTATINYITSPSSRQM